MFARALELRSRQRVVLLISNFYIIGTFEDFVISETCPEFRLIRLPPKSRVFIGSVIKILLNDCFSSFRSFKSTCLLESQKLSHVDAEERIPARLL